VLSDYYQRWTVRPAAPPPPTAPDEFDPLPQIPLVPRVPPPHPSGVKQFAEPGTFYVTKRRKVTSRAGVQAVSPGELVHLLERMPDGRMKVTIDNLDFVMRPDEVTSDLDVARDAEKQYFDRLRTRR
jgi:hypothetical protein